LSLDDDSRGMLTIAILFTIAIAAFGGLWFLKLRQNTKAADAKASTLFKSTAGTAGTMNLDAVRAMQRGENIDEWDDDDEEVPMPAAHRRAAGAPAAQRGGVDGNDDDVANVLEGEGAAVPAGVALNKGERRKQEKLAEKESRKQGTAAVIAEQRRKRAEAEQKEADAIAAEKLRTADENAALEALRAERKQKEDEGYQQWVGHIAMESKGELGEEGRKEAALRAFLIMDAPRVAKVHVLEEIASNHNVSVDKVVSLMEALIKAKEMSGVFDDRGKFIYVTDEEYQSVARFLRQRGRVSMSELIRETNRVITANETQPQA
jgi:hypothetical protein